MTSRRIRRFRLQESLPALLAEARRDHEIQRRVELDRLVAFYTPRDWWPDAARWTPEEDQ